MLSPSTGGRSFEIEQDFNAMFAQGVLGQHQRVAHDLIQADGFAPGRLFGDKRTQPGDDFACPMCLVGGAVHGAADQLQIGIVVVQHTQAGLVVADDGRQRLVELVGNAGGHFTHGVEPGHMRQFSSCSRRRFWLVVSRSRFFVGTAQIAKGDQRTGVQVLA